MNTLVDLTGSTGLAVPHLVIPVHDGIQAQGDLIVIPSRSLAGVVSVPPGAGWAEVPPEGVELLRGGAGGNAHTLVADPGTCLWTATVADPDHLAIAVLDAMAPVYLLHREHGGTGIAPGTYVVRRQRELAPPPPGPVRRPLPARHRPTPRAIEEARAASRVRLIAD